MGVYSNRFWHLINYLAIRKESAFKSVTVLILGFVANSKLSTDNQKSMKYTYTILYVENVTETIEFYEKALGFSRKFITPENDYGELITGETTIAFASTELGNSNFKKGFEKIKNSGKPFGVELAFTTENIETYFQHAIKSGATEYEPLTEKPWGQKVGYLRDNNGFLIEICTPIKLE
ncbi:VOC family protein [Owenweeksia hongkongensis]|uniref:VOC family protein n=1 Tax=Owenweeksia hongkongensis TaxID=253245 RepID=UPI003A8D4E1F